MLNEELKQLEKKKPERIWFTKEEWEMMALDYDSSIEDKIKEDPDYCIRGKVLNPDTGLYADHYLADMEE